MLLPLHIVIALSNLALAGYALFSPSRAKLRATYALTALTFASGFYLVLTRPVNLVQVCTEGLVYLGVVFALIFASNRKLSQATDYAKK